MARALKSIALFFILLLASLLLSSKLSPTEARPLKPSRNGVSRENVGFFTKVDSSGPSDPGVGHRSVSLQTSLAIVKDGPSPGEGHH
ncbi:hypothetical protein Pyn_33749 [Prunus yedoensis var. nudiflora]|uniref:Uncharacterized protein n=1 Tax=Prunus yedoensis var. nudiflora TaxID=2094558 RepID=A0A314Y1M9_PRUYE|nr:hypothetical protein Pyn_33749 [Prunus yedoensis var. nudiflora]